MWVGPEPSVADSRRTTTSRDPNRTLDDPRHATWASWYAWLLASNRRWASVNASRALASRRSVGRGWPAATAAVSAALSRCGLRRSSSRALNMAARAVVYASYAASASRFASATLGGTPVALSGRGSTITCSDAGESRRLLRRFGLPCLPLLFDALERVPSGDIRD